MEELFCAAPGCGKTLTADYNGAIHPAKTEYHLVPLCRDCTEEAEKKYQVFTCELSVARELIEQHQIQGERRTFFLSFTEKQTKGAA